MLLISAGMQKAGSAYFYNLLNDLLINAGYPDTREIKIKYKLENQLLWYNNAITNFNRFLLIKLLLISFREKGLVVKTHLPPTRLLNYLLKFGLIKLIYIYRDPRDVLLSAIDHGKRLIDSGGSQTFAQMSDFDSALINVKVWVNNWYNYELNHKVLCIKYEDLMTKPQSTLVKVMNYINIKVASSKVEEVLFKYSKDNSEAKMHGLHYNKAKINRFKDELTEKEVAILKDELGEQIVAMGYAIDA